MGIPKVKLSFQVFAHLQGKPFSTELFPQLQVDWIPLVTKRDSMVARSVGKTGLAPWIDRCLTVRKVWLLEATGTFWRGSDPNPQVLLAKTMDVAAWPEHIFKVWPEILRTKSWYHTQVPASTVFVAQCKPTERANRPALLCLKS